MHHRKLLFKDLARHLVPYLLILSFVLILCSPELLAHAFVGGGDTYFHINQTYEDAMQIQSKHFSYFLSMFSWNHSARIVNALYAPILQYLFGAILLMCKTWTNFSCFIVPLVATLCGYSMYIVCVKLHVRRCFATPIACMYIMSHAIMQWIGCDAFMGVGAIVVPYIFLVGTHIMERHRINPLTLALVLSIAVQMHLLTAVVGTVVLMIYCAFGIIHSKHRMLMIRNGLIAAVITILASGNIISALINVYSTNQIMPTFFQINMFDTSARFQKINFETGTGFENVPLGIYFTCILVIIFGLLLFKREKPITRLNLGLGIFFLWLSSYYFPWDKVAKAVNAVTVIIQFPCRFFIYFWAPLLLVVGRLATDYSKGFHHKYNVPVASACLWLLVATIFVPCYSYTTYLKNSWNRPGVVRYTTRVTYFNHSANNIRRDLNRPPLHTGLYNIQKQVPDYLPTNQKINNVTYYTVPTEREGDDLEGNHHIHYRISNNHIHLTWYQTLDKKQLLPIVKYHDTTVVFNHHRLSDNVPIDVSGIPKVHIPYGKNTLDVSYRTPFYFKFSCFLAILAWLYMLGMVFKHQVLRKI